MIIAPFLRMMIYFLPFLEFSISAFNSIRCTILLIKDKVNTWMLRPK